jgi:NarL family two-component system sensor histidine kinase YdfH
MMKPIRAFLNKLGPSSLDDDVDEVRPFFIIVFIVLMFLYVSAVYASPVLRQPVRLASFTVLMVIHGALYWYVGWFTKSYRRSISYLVLQGVLAFVLVLLSDHSVLILGLYPPLIGIASGILPTTWQKAAAIVAYLGVAFLTFILVTGGDAFWDWAWTAIPLTLFVVVYVVLYTRQVEAREQVQALLDELETAHHQLAEYAAQVEDLTLVNERQRMARELHDTLTQGVAGLILQLEAVNAHLTNSRADRAQEIVQQALVRARETLTESRRAIDDLRAEVSTPELADAIRKEVNRFTTATGIPCELELTISRSIAPKTCDHIIRIVAEGLTNIARHAQASRVWLRVAVSGDNDLKISLRDDGMGFDLAEIAARSGHYGLLGMRERARLAGGAIEIQSAAGEGTTLHLILPLPEAQDTND